MTRQRDGREPVAATKCAHVSLSVKRRASGIHFYIYDMTNPAAPWTFADDWGSLSIPKFGECEDCGKRIRIPIEKPTTGGK